MGALSKAQKWILPYMKKPDDSLFLELEAAINIDLVKSVLNLAPMKTGVQNTFNFQDSRLHGNDKKVNPSTLYETVNIAPD